MLPSTELLQKILDTIEEGFLVSNADGVIVGFNRQAKEILGLSDNQILGKTLVHPNWQQVSISGEPMSVDELPSSITRATGEIVKDFIMGLKARESSIKWLRVNTQTLDHGEMKYVYSTFIDVTEKHNLKAEARIAKERLKDALKDSEIAVWDVDVKTGEIYCSEEWRKIVGCEPMGIEDVFEQWKHAIHPDDRELVLKNLSNCVDDLSDGFTVDYRLINKDGSLKWVSSMGRIMSRTDDGLPERFSGTIKDVTEKRKIVEKLKANEEKFRNAFHYSAIGMALVDLRGRWIDVNPALCEMLGYSKEEFFELTFQEITHPDDLAENLKYVEQTLKREIETFNMEKRYFHKNGNIVWSLLTVSLMWNNETNSPGFFIAQIIDITRSKELITQMEVKNSQLELTTLDLENKIEQLEEFNRIVAHNLRGPVGNIVQLSEMLHEEPDAADLYIPLLREASAGLDSTLKELIKILEVKLNNTIVFQQCFFEDIVSKVKSMLNIQIYNENIVFNTAFEVKSLDYPSVYLESVLYNLISNAIKYRRQNVTPEVKLRTYIEDKRVILEVSDNGLGIDLNKYGHQIFKLNKIFHEGFDSKGLGLFILKNQIETLGGSISVESEPNVGSTFKVIF